MLPSWLEYFSTNNFFGIEFTHKNTQETYWLGPQLTVAQQNLFDSWGKIRARLHVLRQHMLCARLILFFLAFLGHGRTEWLSFANIVVIVASFITGSAEKLANFSLEKFSVRFIKTYAGISSFSRAFWLLCILCNWPCWWWSYSTQHDL